MFRRALRKRVGRSRGRGWSNGRRGTAGVPAQAAAAAAAAAEEERATDALGEAVEAAVAVEREADEEDARFWTRG